MSKEHKLKKAKQLGMNAATAAGRLRKMLLFNMSQKLDMDTCYQCSKKIESIDNFSIEHKQPWLDTDNPRELYFDLDNIAFSHLRCNILARRRCGFVGVEHGWHPYKKGCRCAVCKAANTVRVRNYRKRIKESL